MTDATLRRLMNSGKGRDLGRAMLYMRFAADAVSMGIDEYKTNITEDSISDKLLLLNQQEALEFTRIANIYDTIRAKEETAMAHIQHAARRCEYLTGRLTSAWLFELLQESSSKAYALSGSSKEPGYYCIMNYSDASPYHSELCDDANFAYSSMLESLRNVKTFNVLVDIVAAVYRINELPQYWGAYDASEELEEQYNSARNTLINYIDSKSLDCEAYKEIINNNFPELVTSSLEIGEAQKRKATSIIKELCESAAEMAFEVLYE